MAQNIQRISTNNDVWTRVLNLCQLCTTLKVLGKETGTSAWYQELPDSPLRCQISRSIFSFVSPILTVSEPTPLPYMWCQKRIHMGESGTVVNRSYVQKLENQRYWRFSEYLWSQIPCSIIGPCHPDISDMRCRCKRNPLHATVHETRPVRCWTGWRIATSSILKQTYSNRLSRKLSAWCGR